MAKKSAKGAELPATTTAPKRPAEKRPVPDIPQTDARPKREKRRRDEADHSETRAPDAKAARGNTARGAREKNAKRGACADEVGALRMRSRVADQTDVNADPPQNVPIFVYDLNGTAALPVDASEATDEKAMRARALAASVIAFYRDVFGRASYDNAGGRVLLVLGDESIGGAMRDPRNESLRFSNKWCGYRLSPDAGKIEFEFRAFAEAPDYMAHEFQHAVTARCADLDYQELQQAALHESLSDVFALSFLDWLNRRSGVSTPPEWWFGRGTAHIAAPFGLEGCTRNFVDPHDIGAWDSGFADIADLMQNLKSAPSPYQISYIPTRAFRATAIKLGAVADAARVWYAALTSGSAMRAVKTIHRFADLTCGAASELDELRVRAGARPVLLRAVTEGWAQVGVIARPTPTQAPHVVKEIAGKFLDV